MSAFDENERTKRVRPALLKVLLQYLLQREDGEDLLEEALSGVSTPPTAARWACRWSKRSECAVFRDTCLRNLSLVMFHR
jgi:hypothetical protein